MPRSGRQAVIVPFFGGWGSRWGLTLTLKQFQSQRDAFHKGRRFPAFGATVGRGHPSGQISSFFQSLPQNSEADS